MPLAKTPYTGFWKRKAREVGKAADGAAESLLERTEMREVEGNAVIMGNICVIDEPDSLGRSDEVDRIAQALVIQFKSKEDIRQAIRDGRCRFTIFEKVEP